MSTTQLQATINTDSQPKAAKSKGRLPQFAIIGAAKCGTTTLQRCLRDHPGIFMCEPKEPEFFSDDAIWERGETWYRSLFEDALPNQICGEASTTYTRWPHTADAAGRLCAMIPQAKLIYIMRHPVERAYSHYAHHMRLGVTKSFEQALEDSDIYIDCSFYMMQIERYLRFIDRDQMHFMLIDDLKADRRGAITRVQEFLNVEVLPIWEQEEAANVGGPDHYIRQQTTQRLRAIPGMSAVADALPRGFRDQVFDMIKVSPIGKALKQKVELKPMLPETRKRLLDLYAQPNAELEAFLGRDLSHWSK